MIFPLLIVIGFFAVGVVERGFGLQGTADAAEDLEDAVGQRDPVAVDEVAGEPERFGMRRVEFQFGGGTEGPAGVRRERIGLYRHVVISSMRVVLSINSDIHNLTLFPKISNRD